MSSLTSINQRLDKIKKDYEINNPKEITIFVTEDEFTANAIVDLSYDNKHEKVICHNLKEYKIILNYFMDYTKRIFLNVKRPNKGHTILDDIKNDK